MFLVGVFLNDSEPIGLGPVRLDFSNNENYTVLSPLLNQTFFIGDGLTGTGSGSIQQIFVPTAATRLYLGFADGNDFTGPPGSYADNLGSLVATYNIAGGVIDPALVPEPSSMILICSGGI